MSSTNSRGTLAQGIGRGSHELRFNFKKKNLKIKKNLDLISQKNNSKPLPAISSNVPGKWSLLGRYSRGTLGEGVTTNQRWIKI